MRSAWQARAPIDTGTVDASHCVAALSQVQLSNSYICTVLVADVFGVACVGTPIILMPEDYHTSWQYRCLVKPCKGWTSSGHLAVWYLEFQIMGRDALTMSNCAVKPRSLSHHAASQS